MKKKAFALVPLVARRKRRAKAKEGAKFGGPAAALAAGAVLFAFLRRKKKDKPDFSNEEVKSSAPAQTEAAAQDADAQTLDATTDSGGTSAGEDSLGSAPISPSTTTVDSDVVIPDMSADDPLVREQTNAAASEAGAIGGTPAPPPGDTEGMSNDPATRAAEEASGESYEGFEQAGEELGSRRETGG